MNVETTPLPLATIRPEAQAARTAFIALLARDMHVLRNSFGMFLARMVMQPLLLVFVWTYVFPKIGQNVGAAGGNGPNFATLLVPGTIAAAAIFQGIQWVALPLVQEFGWTREIEDRVLAPMPVAGVAIEKIVSGTIQALIAGVIVLPIVLVIPAEKVHLDPQWWTPFIAVLVALVCACLGLAVGTRVPPQQVPLLFSLLVLPMTFLGAIYYPWARLGPIAWLKWAVLINPLVYMSEGLRAALTPHVEHMPIAAIFGGLLVFAGLLGWAGIRGFANRVLT